MCSQPRRARARAPRPRRREPSSARHGNRRSTNRRFRLVCDDGTWGGSGEMFKDNWRTFGFWRWWWRSHVPADAKYMAAVLLAGVLLVGGYFASGHLAGRAPRGAPTRTSARRRSRRSSRSRSTAGRSSSASPSSCGKTIVHSSTAWATSVDTRVVTTPGGLRYVTQEGRPLRPGRPQADGARQRQDEDDHRDAARPDGEDADADVVTNQQTVTNQSTVVVNKSSTVTQPVTTVETHTVTLPPDTVTQTETDADADRDGDRDRDGRDDGSGTADHDHDHAPLAARAQVGRMRGSRNPYVMSMSRLNTITQIVEKTTMPVISGRSARP